jgi:hypothetical protein
MPEQFWERNNLKLKSRHINVNNHSDIRVDDSNNNDGEISSSHGGEYDVHNVGRQSFLHGSTSQKTILNNDDIWISIDFWVVIPEVRNRHHLREKLRWSPIRPSS